MDGLWLIRGIAPPGITVGVDGWGHHPPAKVSAVAPRASGGGSAVETAALPSQQSYLFPRPLRRLWPGGGGGGGGGLEVRCEEVVAEEKTDGSEEAPVVMEQRRRNWVINILRVRSLWAEGEGGGGLEEREEEVAGGDPAVAAVEEGDRCVGCGGGDGMEGCIVEEGGEKPIVFDRESFSRLLRRVSLVEAELYAKLSYLGNLAYTIPKIKPRNLLKYHGLRFVTSSLEKRGKSSISDKDQMPSQDNEPKEETGEVEESGKQQENGSRISAPAAYQIAASAASYLQSRTKDVLPFGSTKAEGGQDSTEERRKDGMEGGGPASSEEASFVATTNSVTAMVAGKEEMKQAVAKDLNSPQSSPCEWFICDDDSSTTRYFVIQGSGSLASWQANLLFEPIQFEGLDVLVHRGIYEAAKGIYQQMLPEIQAHLKSHGNSATLRFTGHSLGGSLALLVNLMLLIREEAPSSSLLPVITFGAPSIMCGGDYLLQKLGLPKSHVQAITMHRDIVPRAFSCNYPDHVSKILKAINANFRNHPCLKNQKMLYAPMGKLLILQPEEKFSPPHPLLPSGSGLYLLDNSLLDSDDSARPLQAAQSAFLNTPHPLEILSDRSAYGSEGTVYRDHDMDSYLISVREVIRQEVKLIRKAKREQRRRAWWPLVAAQDLHASIIAGQHAGSSNLTEHHFSFAGVLHGGRETLKQLGRLVASQHVQMVVVLLIPARLLLLGVLSIVNFK